MKHLRYLRYLLRHKCYVFLAGLRTGAPIWRLIIHDWSKFLPQEWEPYATYFYSVKPPIGLEWDKQQEAFDRAWLHHQHFNPHHWQYWTLREDSGAVKLLAMPDDFAREMLADWMGAGRAITGKWGTRAWYEKNRSNIQLNPYTRSFIEGLLDELEPVEDRIMA